MSLHFTLSGLKYKSISFSIKKAASNRTALLLSSSSESSLCGVCVNIFIHKRPIWTFN